MQPYDFDSVLSTDGKAGGDCVIEIEIDGELLKDCKSMKRGDHFTYQVPAQLLHAGTKTLHATSHDEMPDE